MYMYIGRNTFVDNKKTVMLLGGKINLYFNKNTCIVKKAAVFIFTVHNMHRTCTCTAGIYTSKHCVQDVANSF